jgi:hypothetical protein
MAMKENNVFYITSHLTLKKKNQINNIISALNLIIFLLKP